MSRHATALGSIGPRVRAYPAGECSSGAQMTRVHEWLALLRVHQGGVTRLTDSGHYLNQGRAVADYLAEAFDELIGTGRLALGAADANGRQRQVCVTHAGQLRYAKLGGHEARRGR